MICNRYGIGSISIGLLQCMSPGKKSLNSYSFVLFDLIGITLDMILGISSSQEVSAIVASINKVDDAPPFTPLSWATELGKISKHFLAVGEKAALHKEDRTVTEYLTNWVSPSFIYPFDKAGTCSSSLHSAFQSAFGIHFGIWAGFLVY